MRFRQLGSVSSLQRSGREIHGRLHFSNVSAQTFAGPVNVVTRWKLYELSLTSLGADEQAKIRGMGAERAEEVQRAVEEFCGRAMNSAEKLNALGGNAAETLGKLHESGGDIRERLPLTLARLQEMIEDGFREAYQ